MKKAAMIAFAAILAGALALLLLKNRGEGKNYEIYPIAVVIDFFQNTGETIKPLHGVNNGPKFNYEDGTFRHDATKYFKQAGIPYVRTHDSEYPYGKDLFIDIHCVFPDMEADPSLESSYHFAESDQYIEAIVNSGSQVFFRLGESIDHSGNDLYINPPADYEKWARICEGIIRHYNEGFADGFYYGIEYWEIWNEPDNSPMWTGTDEQYYELYKTCSLYLKSKFPELKIGGYGAAGTGDDYMREFLTYISQDENVPLDFFSWHIYTAYPADFLSATASVKEILEEYGYGETELILDEWNYVNGWDEQSILRNFEVLRSTKGAAYAASALISMQNAGVDMAMYYDAHLLDIFCGLYEEGFLDRLRALPSLKVFEYFNRLYELGNEAELSVEAQGNTFICAAGNETGKAVLVSSYGLDPETKARLTIYLKNGYYTSAQIHTIDSKHPKGKTVKAKQRGTDLVLDILPDSVVLIEFN